MEKINLKSWKLSFLDQTPVAKVVVKTSRSQVLDKEDPRVV
jgi:hypothetical protein